MLGEVPLFVKVKLVPAGRTSTVKELPTAVGGALLILTELNEAHCPD